MPDPRVDLIISVPWRFHQNYHVEIFMQDSVEPFIINIRSEDDYHILTQSEMLRFELLGDEFLMALAFALSMETGTHYKEKDLTWI